jgi:hypothetical protein
VDGDYRLGAADALRIETNPRSRCQAHDCELRRRLETGALITRVARSLGTTPRNCACFSKERIYKS